MRIVRSVLLCVLVALLLGAAPGALAKKGGQGKAKNASECSAKTNSPDMVPANLKHTDLTANELQTVAGLVPPVGSVDAALLATDAALNVVITEDDTFLDVVFVQANSRMSMSSDISHSTEATMC